MLPPITLFGIWVLTTLAILPILGLLRMTSLRSLGIGSRASAPLNSASLLNFVSSLFIAGAGILFLAYARVLAGQPWQAVLRLESLWILASILLVFLLWPFVQPSTAPSMTSLAKVSMADRDDIRLLASTGGRKTLWPADNMSRLILLLIYLAVGSFLFWQPGKPNLQTWFPIASGAFLFLQFLPDFILFTYWLGSRQTPDEEREVLFFILFQYSLPVLFISGEQLSVLIGIGLSILLVFWAIYQYVLGLQRAAKQRKKLLDEALQDAEKLLQNPSDPKTAADFNAKVRSRLTLGQTTFESAPFSAAQFHTLSPDAAYQKYLRTLKSAISSSGAVDAAQVTSLNKALNDEKARPENIASWKGLLLPVVPVLLDILMKVVFK